MGVTVAKNAGFCFGVGRACDKVGNAINNAYAGERIYTLGRLIHNDTYNSRLKEKGVGKVNEDEIGSLCDSATETSPVTLFVRAHGMTQETEELLRSCSEKNPYFKYVDCTCSYVRKIHKIVEELDENSDRLLILGSKDHPEVVGFSSRFGGEKYIFSSSSELKALIESGIIKTDCEKCTKVVAQTTQSLDEWLESKKLLEKVYTKPIIFDTICSVTESRQLEAARLAQESDFMIVIGSKGSSNSTKLYSVCSEKCENTVMIESCEELKLERPFPYKNVGIAAGASTPRDIIQEVEKTMSEVMENFEEMLESSLKTLNTGDTVTGYVTAVNDGEIQLDLGAKVTGRIEFDQITDDSSAKLSEMFKIGDAVEAFVIRVSDVEGFATLSKKRVDSDKNWTKIVEAKENDEVLEGVVTEVVRGGVIVLTCDNKVFVPASHTGVPRDKELSVLVGTHVKLKVIEVEGNKKAKGSIRLVLREEKKALENEFWANIEEGKEYDGVVKSMTAYGAFVDLGGVDGMVHVSELSWKRLKSPAEVIAVGDKIHVFVKSVDKEAKRISLGYKTEATNPWFIFTHTYAVGDVVSVKIVNMMPFGAFAEIVDGVDGLIHISQIADRKIGTPAEVLEIGQVVDAKITEINEEKKNVSLSIRALIEAAKADEAEVPEGFEDVVVEEATDAE